MAATVVNITSLICVLLLLFNLSVPPYSQSSTRVDLELIGYSISTYFLSLVNLNLLGQVTFVYLFCVCVCINIYFPLVLNQRFYSSPGSSIRAAGCWQVSMVL